MRSRHAASRAAPSYGFWQLKAVTAMDDMEAGNFLVYAAERGDGHLHLVRPVKDGDR